MKKYFKIIIASSFIFIINSCNEDAILDLKPINSVPVEEAYSTPSLIQSSINGMYNAAAIGQYNGTAPNGGRGYIWGAAFVQQGDCRGEDVVNQATFYQLTYTATYDAATANNTYYWVDGYRLINRCNLAIEGVSDAVSNGIITPIVGNDFIGQAKFLRAITHFELLMYFARPYNHTSDASHLGIPYREIAINTDEEIKSELLKPRNTVAECYTKILADLTDAENKITNILKNKASKGAAIAFKSRVYLHKRDWDNVIVEGSKLTSYSLTPSPNDPFVTANNLSNSESIFSISHSATLNPGPNAALASIFKGRRLVNISPIIWRDPSWLSDDKRRQEGVMVETVAGIKYTNKYKDNTSNTDAAPIIRYAEVLLNMAEANARKSAPDLASALTQLNLVRNRSLASPATQTYTAASFADATALVEAILKERRIEFLIEGRRWSDIHRLQKDDLFPIDGIPAKITNGVPAASLFTLGTPYTGPYGEAKIISSDRRILWPIPLLETNNNPTLKEQQNPGW
jgi:starch-binding outer membrane protein, SusD/RagB family